MSTLTTRLRGLAATLGLVAFVIGVPVLLLAMHAVPDLATFSWSRLTAPDDGTLLVAVLTVICWIAWAIFTCQVAASIVSQLRGVQTPRLPGLSMPQVASDRLVAAAALLFVAIPSATAFLPEPKATAASSATAQPDDSQLHVNTTASVSPTPADADKTAPAVERYTVKRGDSLWRIAEDRLGDGTRYVEIVDLNEAVLGRRPDFLLPGTVLRVPVAEAPPADSYIVRPGDTLSEIAEDQLGDADAYPSIFKASRSTVQADGAHLTDPELVLPGWKLTIPGEAPSRKAPEPTHPKPPEQKRQPTAHPTAIAPPTTSDEPATSNPKTTDHGDTVASPSWLIPGLAGTGSILGGALWLTLRAQRRTQLRHRRPGTIIPPPPAELVPVEKSAHATAFLIAPRLDDLDTALRSMPPLPRLVTLSLAVDGISVTLREAANLPSPWIGAGTAWRIALADIPERPADSFPPYPLLVSVGQATDDGSFLFLNLEELRTVTVTGDTDRKASFARHLAAELAVNPWSIVTTVDLLGLGSDLASFNLDRVHTHPVEDTGFIAQLARDLSSITQPSDPDDFHAAIIATASRPAPDLDRLAETLQRIPGRASAALVVLEGEPRSSGTHLHLTGDGHLQAAGLGIDVAVAGLSEDEARACATLLDLTLDKTVIRVASRSSNTAVSDLSGALTERLTEPRPDGPAGEESLLPLDALTYADAAATTVEDVETLAPRASPVARDMVDAMDAELDQDLALWESPIPSAAKLTLLGPVSARTTGDTKATAHRRPFYVELLAYLALHPDGVSASKVADAFGLRPERVRVDMSQLRRWLGTNPRTGSPYLPKAESSRNSDSPALYKLEGVLCDLDLFRRLRTRGQSRGADGMGDLIAALRLVTGEPFTELRKDHWSWLLDGDRWDHIMTSAIVDVGHIVTTHALAVDDRDLARWAAQVAYVASPYDEVAQLDMIQAERAHGDDEKADRDLNEKVLNRRDDELPPVDLPRRTSEVIRDKRWQPQGRRPRRTG